MSEETKHEWQRRIVARSGAIWKAFYSNDEWFSHLREYGDVTTETIIQRRRRRSHLDPTPCEGIEDPIWRDWIASDDPDIQGVLISKGMPFRSLGKMTWQIIKKEYSYHPWRLCDERGNELQEIKKFDHPTFGPSHITASISAATKTQLINEMLSKLENQAEIIERLRQRIKELTK